MVAVAVTTGCDAGLTIEGRLGEPIAAEIAGWVPSVQVAIDDDAPRRFLVDTGAPLTLLDGAAVGRPGPDATVALSIGAVKISELRVPVFELFPEGGDDNAYAGIIGGDLLSEVRLTVDYQVPTLWLRSAGDDAVLPPAVDVTRVQAPVLLAAEVRGGGTGYVPATCRVAGCKFEVAATRLLVGVLLEGETTPRRFLVDTGASLVVMRQAVIDALPNARPRLSGVTVGTATGVVTAYLTRVGAMTLTAAVPLRGPTIHSVPVLVLPDESLFDAVRDEVGIEVDGLIGGSYLRNFLVTTDLEAGTLGLARYRDDSHVPSDEYVRLGFAIRADGQHWLVRDVYPGTSAAAQGLRVGDRLAAVAGTATDGLLRAEIDALLDGPLGTPVEVTVATTPAPTTVTIVVEDLLPDYVTQ